MQVGYKQKINDHTDSHPSIKISVTAIRPEGADCGE
jgi:hypothetical protein